MKPLFIIFLILTLASCTTYKIHRTPDGEITVLVRTSRDLAAPDLHYRREGNNAEFTFSAASVKDGTVEMMNMASQVFQAILSGRLVVTPTEEQP